MDIMNVPTTDEAIPFATSEIDLRQQLEQAQQALSSAEAEIDRRNRNIIALTTFAYRANRADNLVALLRLALMQALETTAAPVGAVVLVDAATKELHLGFHKGLTVELMEILTGNNLDDGAIALMPHLVTGTGALLEYQTTDDAAELALLRAGRVSSLASFPLVVDKKLAGAMLVGLQSARGFRSSELTFLMAVSQETAIALESLQLRERLWRVAESLLQQEDIDPTNLDLTLANPINLPDIVDVEVTRENLAQALPVVRMEYELHQQNTDLQILMALSEMVNHTLNLSEILQCAVDQTKAILNTDAAWLYLIEEGELKIQSHAGLSRNYVHGMRRLKANDELEGEVFSTNKPCFVASIFSRPHKIWVDKEGLRAMGAVPITRRANSPIEGGSSWQVMGVLATGIRSTHGYEWSLHEMDLLIAIANQVASAVEKAKSYAIIQDNEVSLRGSNEILREINNMLIQKNAGFERFVHQTLKPSLKQANDAVAILQNAKLNPHQREQFTNLVESIEKLSNSSKDVLNS